MNSSRALAYDVEQYVAHMLCGVVQLRTAFVVTPLGYIWVGIVAALIARFRVRKSQVSATVLKSVANSGATRQ